MIHFKKGVKVEVTHASPGYDAAPGEYIVERYVSVENQDAATQGVPIVGETRQPFYFLLEHEDASEALAAPEAVVRLAQRGPLIPGV